jgi:SHS2 domain-containing protein
VNARTDGSPAPTTVRPDPGAEPAAPFTLLPHTADLRVAIGAPSLEELYTAAAATVRHLLVGGSPVAETEEREIEPGSSELAERFFRFVRELLFLYECEGFVPSRVLPGSPLRVAGERFDPRRHRVERQIKAVTRHGFALGHDAGGYRAEILFDV